MSSPFLPTAIDYPKTEDEEQIRNFIIDTFVNDHENINAKEIAQYFPSETQTGQRWFKQGKTNDWVLGYRVAFDCGPLPGVAGPFMVDHNISDISEGFAVTYVSAIANRDSPFSAIPLVVNEVTSTEINIQVTASTINYESCIVVIEYIRSR